MKKNNRIRESTDSKLEQERRELAVVPIFRSNDLYQAMFPEIEPVFQKGEDLEGYSPEVKLKRKKLIDFIVKNENKTIILDQTCEEQLWYVGLAELPDKFELDKMPKEFPYEFEKLLKIHYNIDYSFGITIDSRLREKLGQEFSPQVAKVLFEIAKRKNENIQQVYILTLNIADHTTKDVLNLKEYGNQAKEISHTISYTSGWNTEEEKKRITLVSTVLKDVAWKELGVEPELVATLNKADIKHGDLIVVDRHNPAIVVEKINEIFPKQISQLPLETELYNNQKFLGDEMASKGLVNVLRKIFENVMD